MRAPAVTHMTPTRLFSVKYALAYFGSCVAWAAPTQILLGVQMIELRPESKETSLALVMMIGGAAQVAGSFLTGPLSDRSRLSTASRLSGLFGRRMPWAALGALCCALTLGLLSLTPPFWAIVALWSAFQVAMCFVTNNLLTVMVDTYPRARYGAISGLLGPFYTLGLVGGTVVATALSLELAYLAAALILLALIGQFFLGSHRITGSVFQEGADGCEQPSDHPPAEAHPAAAPPPEAGPLTHEGGRRPTGYRDYTFVFISRFVIHLANYTSLFYLLYYLRDHIGFAQPDLGVLILTLFYAACTTLTAFFGGIASDRSGRRKVFVIASGVGVSGAAALALQLLGGYPGLYVACAALCLVGVFAVIPVRSSR